MGGISNFQIEEAFKKIGDKDLLENFVGVFPSNRMNRFIDHAAISDSNGKYPFAIANTDAEGKPGIHWWSILDMEPRNDIFLFDSFGLERLKHLGIEKMDRSYNKIKFNMGEYKNCLKKKLILSVKQPEISSTLLVLLE